MERKWLLVDKFKVPNQNYMIGGTYRRVKEESVRPKVSLGIKHVWTDMSKKSKKDILCFFSPNDDEKWYSSLGTPGY